MKKVFVLSTMLLTLLAAGCEKPSEPYSKAGTKKGAQTLSGTLLTNIINGSLGDMDAIQAICINNAPIQFDGSQDDWRQASACSIYKIGDRAGEVTSVSCDNQPVSVRPNSFPTRYFYEWADNTGPGYGSSVPWMSVVEGDTLRDTIPIPDDLGMIEVSSGSTLNLSQGATLSWSNPSANAGDVVIGVQFTRMDAQRTVVKSSGFAFIKTVPDNGSTFISPDDLSGAQIPVDTKVMVFFIARGGVKTRMYAANTKRMGIIGYTEGYKAVQVEP